MLYYSKFVLESVQQFGRDNCSEGLFFDLRVIRYALDSPHLVSMILPQWYAPPQLHYRSCYCAERDSQPTSDSKKEQRGDLSSHSENRNDNARHKSLTSFVVRVPVLSVQMTLTQPKVSTLGSFRTFIFLDAIHRVPNDKQSVMTAGNPLVDWVAHELPFLNALTLLAASLRILETVAQISSS